MIKKYKHSRLVLSLVLAGIPMMASATELIVEPPKPPAGVAAEPGLIAPAKVSSLTEQAAVKLDIPPAPKATAETLTPPPIPVPVAVKAKVEKPAATPVVKKKATAVVAKKADPFASLVTTPVSDSQLNRFVFPEKVEGVYFPEGAPLTTCDDDAAPNDPCKPVFLNDRKMMLLQLKAGAKGPVQMLVHLHSGRMVTLNLAPGHGPGAVVRIDDAEDSSSDAKLAAKSGQTSFDSTPSETSDQSIKLLAKFAQGDIPYGFDAVSVGAPTKFSHFEVVPMAAWEDGSGLAVHLMQVRAFDETPVTIAPALFRAENVLGVSLDKTNITNKAPALLYLVEKTGK